LTWLLAFSLSCLVTDCFTGIPSSINNNTCEFTCSVAVQQSIMKFSLGAVAAIAFLSSSHGFTLSRQQNVGRAYIASTPGVAHAQSQIGISPQSQSTNLFATIEETAASPSLGGNILSKIKDSKEESKGWAEAFDLSSESGAAFHALFSGIRSSTLGPKGIPYYLKSKDVVEAIGEDGFASENNGFDGFFSFDDLAKALEEDFLDADRGTTDNRKGWRVSVMSKILLLVISSLPANLIQPNPTQPNPYLNLQGISRFNSSRIFIRRCTNDTG
jgi:hypothetical protein